MTISDEHNFLEAVPFVGRVMSKILPNRVLAVTPPMVDDIRKFKHKTMGVPKPDDAIKSVQYHGNIPVHSSTPPKGTSIN